ncbi:SDR family NAD(P)-dependent oxidoreductase [Marinoscillum furvescens]|uniref:NADP-dependent 3-hydroxy acid dehydrogenase YdfG n=1 Tax=Marinoscillum furvescens DSM 4134 TaxID=1122208 RepID=A0A3D9LGE0_MARFU|nr:SDR family NAD(P)-dependent oxidoreductase [Marinoscillum furvescens]REE05750.1 NADP-dependent 3-hydroxy acid dehydrogenase YdfG [Marinoscillum furvescens DSM 4134]
MSKPIALISGATSGIGKATANLLAAHYRLIICGRRADRLQELQSNLPTDVKTLSFDVRDQAAVFAAIDGLPEEWKAIDLLINNAGNAHGLSFIHEGDIADWDAMIDINVKGLLYVSKAVLPHMIANKSGHIINIGSIAGVDVYPKGNVYNASKHAVDAISKGMRQDLHTHGIKVSEVKPGLVNTEFSEVRFKGDKTKADKVYEGFTPLSAEDIADTIRYIALAPAHVNIADVLILPTAQATSTMVHKKA